MPTPSTTPKARPLSPHLQIYKPQLTSALSILHRISGVALSFGIVVFVGWLVALASGPDTYNGFAHYATTCIGQLVLAGISLAFFYHLCCGIRHLFWDAGKGLEIKDVYKSGRMAVMGSAILTLILWYFVIYGVSR